MLCGQKCLSDVKGEWVDWFEMIETAHYLHYLYISLTHYNQGLLNTISECTMVNL